MSHVVRHEFRLLLTLAVVGMLPRLAADGPPKAIQVTPDTVYLDKVGSETSISRTVQVLEMGMPVTGLTFNTSASTSSGGSWLAVSPASGSVPGSFTITGTPGTLAPGVYSGTVTVTSSVSGIASATVNVMLRIFAAPGGGSGGPPAVLVHPGALNFMMVEGGTNPSNQTLDISSPAGGTTFSWTATKSVSTPSGGTWLGITPASGTGPGSITVSVNGAGLVAGHYSGSVNVSSGSTNDQVLVNLDVRPATAAQLVIDPRAFNFIVLPGGPNPAPKTLHVKNAGSGTLSWTATATSSGWLSISPASGNAPSDITLSVTPAGLTPGMYSGSVAVTAAGHTDTARVFLRIVGQPGGNGGQNPNQSAVQISPRAIDFTAQVGGTSNPPSATVRLSSKITGLTFTETATTASGGSWLHVAPAAGSIPGSLTVTVTSTGLAAGTYTGLIDVKVLGSVTEERLVPVTFRVGNQGDTPKLTLHPGAVVFQATNGGTNPAPTQVSLGALGAATIPFSATASTVNGGSWLSVSPTSGTAPTSITVTATGLASLAPGVYSGSVVFQATGSGGGLGTTLNVIAVVRAASSVAAPQASPAPGAQGSAVGLFLEPASDFAAVANAPVDVEVMLFGSNGLPLEGANVQIQSSGAEPALALEDAGGGLYTGLFHALASGPIALTAVVSGDSPISFTVGGDVSSSTLPAIFQGGVVNSANFAPEPTPIVPGSFLTLFGRGLAASSAAATGFPLPRELGGVKVMVAGVAAPLIAVVPDSGQGFDQIVFQAPVELSGVTFADVAVLTGGVFTTPEGVAVASTLPALFTSNGSGAGAVSALHADYTPVTSGSPAKPNETILLFGTALGNVQPGQVSGEAAGAGSLVTANVTVTIAGRSATTSFAGLAPGYAGLYQINVTVPADAPSGDDPVIVTADGISSAQGVVIPVSGQ